MTKFSLHHFDEKEEKDDYERPNSKWKSFKSSIPFLALIVFIFVAGGIFYSAEKSQKCRRQSQPQQFANTSADTTESDLLSEVSAVINRTISETNLNTRFKRSINYQNMSEANQNISDNLSAVYQDFERISYWAAVHFVATTITTIGYGDIVPCSAGGQVLALFFAIFGIPLMLVCLAQIGKWLEHVLNRAWHWMSQHKTFDSHHNYANNVPLSVGLAVTFAWILLSSIYFYFTLSPIYKNANVSFSYFTACYFSVITFLTIGYGDIAPLNYQLVISTFIFIFVGLALVTMCIDILQTKMENMFDNMVLIIQNEYKKNVLQADEQSKNALDPNDINRNVKHLMKTTGDGKLFGSYMNNRQKERLMQEYKKQASMCNKSVQATVGMVDHDTEMEIESKTGTGGVDVACQAYRPVWQKRLEKQK